jgi:phospholipase C
MTPRFSPTPTIVAAVTFVAFALLVACSGRGTIAPMPQGQGVETQGHAAPIDALKLRTKTPIQHVFIIIQENRSFDNLFNGYPGANTAPQGLAIQMGASGTPIPGASPTTVPLQPQPLEELWDPTHTLASWLTDWNDGAMDGFSREGIACYTAKCVIPPANTYPTYAYVPQSETVPYWTLAQQYVLADNMFSSNADASFVAHQYLIAGWANHAADYPLEGGSWGCDNPVKTETVTKTRAYGPKESACFTYKTIASELDHKKFDWRYYTVAGGYGGPTGYYWSAFDAINAVRNGPEWTTGSTPKVLSSPGPQQLLTDAASGNIPVGVIWASPWLAWSDHASSGSNLGPMWVANAVNAIGGNKTLWDSSVIFVVWDDWGGWYDHVPPKWLDFDGLGFRVPMLVISPYAKQGYVTHQPYEFGSILKFVEYNFGIEPVSPLDCCYGKKGSDRRASNPVSDVFNFSATPRPFVPIPNSLNKRYFEQFKGDNRPVDTE